MAVRNTILTISGVIAFIAITVQFFSGRTRIHCYTSVETLSNSATTTNCFSIRNGKFSSVYTLDAKSAAKYSTGGGHAIPGLWDGHGHLLQYGEMLESVNLFGSDSLQDARERVAKYVLEHPEEGGREEWIRGIGWDQAAFEGRMPTAEDLSNDVRLRDKYIMLDRVDVHCSWVSQAVLKLLPDRLPETIPGGEIVTDPGLGVFCDNAMDIVRKYWPPIKPEKKVRFLRTGAKELNKFGLVGMHDAGITPPDVKLLESAVQANDWPLRVYAMLECEERNTFCPTEAIKIDRPDGFLTLKSVKLFADGALGSWGSAMIEPYSDRPSTSGSLLVNSTTLTQLAQSWASLGYQVNIHAIGDMANRHAISALQSALESVCQSDPSDSDALHSCQALRRFRIEHAQIIHPDDQKKMHSIGIIPSIQPTHATSDMAYAEKRLGKPRLETEAYRASSLFPLNVVLGSDFPVEPSNPWQGMYAAVARKSPHTGLGQSGGDEGWLMNEALNLTQALRGFTIGPAYGSFMEGKAGVIEPGAYADWVVLDDAIDDIEVEDLRSLKVRETWVAGKLVYKRE